MRGPVNQPAANRIARLLCSSLVGLVIVLLESVPALAVCTISSTSISFGTYDIFSPVPLDTTGSVVYQCGNRDKDITISLDKGGASSFGSRRMLKGTEALNYNLYLDAARTIVWGDGTGGSQTFFEKNPPNNQDISVPIYGRIPAGQGVSTGTYGNTIAVIVNF